MAMAGLAGMAAVLLWAALATPAAAQIQIDAVAGEPFGVARVIVPVGRSETIDRGRFALTQAENRTHYPSFDTHSPGLILSTLLRSRTPRVRAVIAVFLFEGDEPLTVTVETPHPHTITIKPRKGKLAHRRLMNTWWRAYVSNAETRIEAGEYPPVIETYLTSMLSNRLDLPRADLTATSNATAPEQMLDLLAGTESLRAAAMLRAMSQRTRPPEAAMQLPRAAQWLPQQKPRAEPGGGKAEPEVEIEAIARRVPANCFYVRFGSYPNYLWVNELLEDFAADMAQLATLRGVDEKLTGRMKRQLALRESKLAKLFGDTVLEDIAFIGRDLYTREGAAVGILFKAKNAEVFASDLDGQRKYHLKKSKAEGAAETKVKIAGREVSLVSTPDNALRSYLAVDGDFFLVTTSRAIVEGFFATVDGGASLASSESLQLARRLMPLSRGDAVFVHLSPQFLHGLVTPHYQVELARRMDAAAGIEMVQLARMAAAAEGRPADSIATLIGGGFLPPWFNNRSGGSKFLEGKSGEVTCSARGARGAFTPIPDMPATRVTQQELLTVAIRNDYFERELRRMDPITIAIKRTRLAPAKKDAAKKGAAKEDGKDTPEAAAKDTAKKDTAKKDTAKKGAAKDKAEARGKAAKLPPIERVVIDANISPVDEKKYGWFLSMLGPPTTEVIAKAPGDVVNFQASLKGGAILPGAAPHLMYAGLQDAEPRIKAPPVNLIDWYRLIKFSPGYLGAWPKPGLLDALPVGLLGVRGEGGYTRYLLGLWRWEGQGHSVLSFDRNALGAVTPHLKLAAPAEKPAHMRFDMADLSGSKLAGWINGIYRDRALRTSITNVRLMNVLRQQFKITPQRAREEAGKIYGGELVCALGGKYELRKAATPYWTSTAWDASKGVKEEFQRDINSPLRWLRKLHLTLIKDGNHIETHIELDIQRFPREEEEDPALNLLNIFGA